MSDLVGNIQLVNLNEGRVTLLTGTLDIHLGYRSVVLKDNSLFMNVASNNYIKLFSCITGE